MQRYNPRKTRPTPKRGPTYLQAAAQRRATQRSARRGKLAALAPRVHASELKYLDIPFGSLAASTTGAVSLINGVAVGDTAITREGRQCYWKTLEVHGRLSPSDTTTIGCRCDMYIIWDDQPGAAVPAITDIFVESIAGSPHNLNYRERFTTIAHRSFALGPISDVATQAYAGGPVVYLVDIYQKLDLLTTFKGDTNAIGDISKGAMYVVTLGDTAAASGGTFYFTTRLRFSES